MASIGAEGRCYGNQFWDAVCYKLNWLWRLMGYNFGCMIASDTQFDSRGGFSGSSCPMKTQRAFSRLKPWFLVKIKLFSVLPKQFYFISDVAPC